MCYSSAKAWQNTHSTGWKPRIWLLRSVRDMRSLSVTGLMPWLSCRKSRSILRKCKSNHIRTAKRRLSKKRKLQSPIHLTSEQTSWSLHPLHQASAVEAERGFTT
jgi:hypothetical protein